MKNKRRIPKIGMIRYWVDYSGYSVRRGVVKQIAKTNTALRRKYIGIIAPPAFVRSLHVMLSDGRWAHWMPIDDFFCSRKAASESLYEAMCMHAYAQRNSGVDPIW